MKKLKALIFAIIIFIISTSQITFAAEAPSSQNEISIVNPVYVVTMEELEKQVKLGTENIVVKGKLAEDIAKAEKRKKQDKFQLYKKSSYRLNTAGFALAPLSPVDTIQIIGKAIEGTADLLKSLFNNVADIWRHDKATDEAEKIITISQEQGYEDIRVAVGPTGELVAVIKKHQ